MPTLEDEEASLVAAKASSGAKAFPRRLPVVCGGVAALAAVAATIAIVPALMGGNQGPRKVRDIFDPNQLWINENLTELAVPPYDMRQTLEYNINNAWNSFLQYTQIGEELTQSELDDFERRFKVRVNGQCKNVTVLADWEEVVGTALEEQKPTITAQLAKAFDTLGAHGFQIRAKAWMENISRADLQARCGDVDPGPDVNVVNASAAAGQMSVASVLPADFDSATNWPHCAAVIDRLHNQGTCGSCWVFSAAGAMDSRLCIATKGAFQSQFSRTYITSCAQGNGCQGGSAWRAIQFMAAQGAPTGGQQGCLAYFAHGDGTQHFVQQDVAPQCSTRCSNSGYFRSLEADRLAMEEVNNSVWVPVSPAYGWPVPSNWLELIKQNVMDHGPIPVSVQANSNLFFAYSGGVYDVCCDGKSNHAVVMTGWGSQPKEYFAIQNSWGEWGLNDTGFMHIAPCGICHATLPNELKGIRHVDKVNAIPDKPIGPTEPIWTTESGDSCVFPFVYFGYEFTECTSRLHHSLWCATRVATGDMPNVMEWSNCIEREAVIIFTVVSGPCLANNFEGCISRERYEDSESCTISVSQDVKLYTTDFSTEADHDNLFVNGVAFSGNGWSKGPRRVTPTTDIIWTSDFGVSAGGWKLCAVDA